MLVSSSVKGVAGAVRLQISGGDNSLIMVLPFMHWTQVYSGTARGLQEGDGRLSQPVSSRSQSKHPSQSASAVEEHN